MISMSELATGGLWRDVVNFAGPSPAPAVLLPLLDAIAPKWSRWTHFTGMMADVLRTPEHRGQIEEEVAWAEMGYRLWTDHRDAIAGWARASSGEPVTEDEIEKLVAWRTTATPDR